MPTASPSMSASMGVVEFTVKNAVASTTSRRPIATDSSAEISGMPAARREPSVTKSTTKATMTPITSTMDRDTPVTLNSSPPGEPWEPSGRSAMSASTASSRSVSVESGRFAASSSYWREMSAADPSSLIVPSTISSKGDVAVSTWSSSPKSSTASSIVSR